MKAKHLLMTTVLAVTAAIGASAGMHNARGPHAWGDKNHDGICDTTGKPVGQGQGQCMRGNGPRNNAGDCQCRGCDRGQGRQSTQGTPQAPKQ